MEFIENPQKAGFIQKTHGVHGGLMVETFQSLPDEESMPEWAFMELEGGLVPYRLKSDECFIRDNRHLVIFIDDIESPEQGAELLQSQVYFPEYFVKPLISLDNLPVIGKGFKVVFEGHKEVGLFIEMLEIPGNPVLSIDVNGKEILVPASDEYIQKIEEDLQTVYLAVPDELLDLN
ncbi:MAG: hypothetical protein U9N86_02635 [Bacteroidota bacterium]|nr:hypothetical protein [Bacteroidota bacterium]